jgi:hypothetical protein
MLTRLRLWLNLWKLRFRGVGSNPFAPTTAGEVRTTRLAVEDARLINEWMQEVDVSNITLRLSTEFDQGEEDDNGFTINYSNEWDAPRYRDEGEHPLELLHRRIEFGA